MVDLFDFCVVVAMTVAVRLAVTSCRMYRYLNIDQMSPICTAIYTVPLFVEIWPSRVIIVSYSFLGHRNMTELHDDNPHSLLRPRPY